MVDSFYRVFEERHRGSRELIKSRLRVYLPFIQPLLEVYKPCLAIDLGCGRGEWIELLRDTGIDAQGIDLDEGMLTACRELGLSVEQGDAIEYLQHLKAESIAVISAFHVVEHISFGALQILVQEALRVLVPGGLLIIETPNPENLKVATCNFYLDPTHLRPIPPPLLSFLPEYYGFARTKVLRLQEEPELDGRSAVSLSDVLLGVSPDYAVVAQKSCEDSEVISRFDSPFAQDYGIGLDALALNYDRCIGERLEEILVRVNRSAQLEAQLRQAQLREAEVVAQLRQSQSVAGALRQELHALQQSNLLHWQLSKERAQRVRALTASSSWRITAPLRFVTRGSAWLWPVSGQVMKRPHALLKSHALRSLEHPTSQQLLEAIGSWFITHPRIFRPIVTVLRGNERIRTLLRPIPKQKNSGRPSMPSASETPLIAHLTPRASRIYQDLRMAIDERGRTY